MLAPVALAQVEWTARAGTYALHDQTHPSVADPALDSIVTYTIIVWEDERNGDKDIYAQKIDNATGVALWAPDGVPVCTAANDQRNPRAACDSSGGVIITWEDCRNDAQNVDALIYATRLIRFTGEADQRWTANGNVVCAQGAPCLRPRIVGTSDGAFIVWTDARRGQYYRNAFLQYLHCDGGIENNWPGDGAPVG